MSACLMQNADVMSLGARDSKRVSWLMTTRRAAYRERDARWNLGHSTCRSLARGFIGYSEGRKMRNGAEGGREIHGFFMLSDCTLTGGDEWRDPDRPPDAMSDWGGMHSLGDFHHTEVARSWSTSWPPAAFYEEICGQECPSGMPDRASSSAKGANWATWILKKTNKYQFFSAASRRGRHRAMTEDRCCELTKWVQRYSSGDDVGRLSWGRRDTNSYAVELGRLRHGGRDELENPWLDSRIIHDGPDSDGISLRLKGHTNHEKF